MIPEIRKIKMILSQLEADIEVLIEQANQIKEENNRLKEQQKQD